MVELPQNAFDTFVAEIRQLSIQAHADGDIYLYDDNCVPTDGGKSMKAYLGKLAILMKLEAY
jgi:hypothetical protein